MKIEKKLAMFTQITMTEVEEKRRMMIRESEAAFQSAVDEAVRAAKKQAGERINSERYNIEKIKNKQITTASSEARHTLVSCRERMMEALFADVIEDVRAFVAAPTYADYLTQQINNAKTDRYAYVVLTARDMRFAAHIRETTGLTAETSEDDFIGGFRLVSADRKTVSDHTLQTRLNEERQEFTLRHYAELHAEA